MGYREHFILSLTITGIATLFLGLFVFFKSRTNRTNLIFSFYSFSITWWSLTQIGNIYGPSLRASLFWARIEQVGVVFIPTLFLHFVVNFLNLKNKKPLLIFSYIFSFTMAVLSPFTDLISPNAEIKFGLINFGNPGILYHPLFVFFVILTMYCLYELFIELKKSHDIKKKQIPQFNKEVQRLG